MIINGKQVQIKMDGKIFHCALDVTMNFIGGKWKSVVLWYLMEECKRFSELKRHIPGITEKMLSLQLKELEKDGIVIRKIYAEVPPRVEYSLSENGKSLTPILQEMGKWGRDKARKEGVLQEVQTKPEKKKKKTSGKLALNK